MKARFIIILVKLSRFFLKLLGRGGSLPGTIALRLDKNILKKLTYHSKIIVVSGTNGKTTTNNMIYEVMKTQYEKVLCNNRGDNLLVGVTTLLLSNTKMNLEVNADCIVLEVDELNVPHVMKQIPVDEVVINNFFRDQLDRAGEMENIIEKVGGALTNYTNDLFLNGDDPNVARLALYATEASIYYYGVDKTESSVMQSNEASEGKFCPVCNHELPYAFYHYSHIGSFACDHCDFGHYKYYVKANNVDLNARYFEVDGYQFTSPQDAIYSIFNCVAVLALSKKLEIAYETVNSVFKNFELNDGRMEYFDIGRKCLLNLVKNPTGTNEVVKYIMRDDNPKDIVIVLNDNDQDGTDVSWIWDAHFELLLDENTKHIICSGLRAYDMALRIKYAGFKGELIVIEDMDKAIKEFKTYTEHAYVIATYTALQTMRGILRRNA